MEGEAFEINSLLIITKKHISASHKILDKNAFCPQVPIYALIRCKSLYTKLQGCGAIFKGNDDAPINCTKLTIEEPDTSAWTSEMNRFHKLQILTVRKMPDSTTFDLRGFSLLQFLNLEYKDDLAGSTMALARNSRMP